MATHSILLPGKSHGWRSVVGYSPWDRKESDMTERLWSHALLYCLFTVHILFIFGYAACGTSGPPPGI